MKTISDLKMKIINAIDEIDTSKLTLMDLKLLSDTVGVLSSINDKPMDFMDIYSKMSNCYGVKQNTLSDLKGE